MSVFSYLIGDEKAGVGVLIDPAFETKRILEIVEKNKVKVLYIINTHGHPDHIAGNAEIKDATGAKICMHKEDADLPESFHQKMVSRFVGGKTTPKPDILLKHGDILSVGENDLFVIHTPGHTKGSICLYIKGNLFTGDTLFVGSEGRTDLPAGSPEDMLNTLHKKLFKLPGNTRVWPGHNYGLSEFSTIEMERARILNSVPLSEMEKIKNKDPYNRRNRKKGFFSNFIKRKGF